MTDAGKEEEKEAEGFKMKAELVSKKFTTSTYLLKGVTPAFINSIRRAALSLVPTLAIEEVEFVKNSSPLYDEFIAHRLGLVSLKTDIDSYEVPPEDVDPREFAKYHVAFKLSAKGPGMVKASGLTFSDPKIKPIYPETPIVNLLEGQELEFTGIAVMGLGKEHSKWSPGHIFYKNVPELKVKNPKAENASSVANSCPRGLLKVESGKLIVDEKKLFECTLCGACAEAFPDVIELSFKEDEFLFSIDNFGQLKDAEIFKKAMEALDSKFKELSKAV
ncbi:MAG TPA: DNA-directed RNA polymerase subunit D [Candidatus Woesearchaeota archaeon]|nr:DNA-directed RNA polymerase subunit D [Candidatus Woesearchaeota archaeon]